MVTLSTIRRLEGVQQANQSTNSQQDYLNQGYNLVEENGVKKYYAPPRQYSVNSSGSRERDYYPEIITYNPDGSVIIERYGTLQRKGLREEPYLQERSVYQNNNIINQVVYEKVNRWKDLGNGEGYNYEVSEKKSRIESSGDALFEISYQNKEVFENTPVGSQSKYTVVTINGKNYVNPTEEFIRQKQGVTTQVNDFRRYQTGEYYNNKELYGAIAGDVEVFYGTKQQREYEVEHPEAYGFRKYKESVQRRINELSYVGLETTPQVFEAYGGKTHYKQDYINPDAYFITDNAEVETGRGTWITYFDNQGKRITDSGEVERIYNFEWDVDKMLERRQKFMNSEGVRNINELAYFSAYKSYGANGPGAENSQFWFDVRKTAYTGLYGGGVLLSIPFIIAGENIAALERGVFTGKTTRENAFKEYTQNAPKAWVEAMDPRTPEGFVTLAGAATFALMNPALLKHNLFLKHMSKHPEDFDWRAYYTKKEYTALSKGDVEFNKVIKQQALPFEHRIDVIPERTLTTMYSENQFGVILQDGTQIMTRLGTGSYKNYFMKTTTLPSGRATVNVYKVGGWKLGFGGIKPNYGFELMKTLKYNAKDSMLTLGEALPEPQTERFHTHKQFELTIESELKSFFGKMYGKKKLPGGNIAVGDYGEVRISHTGAVTKVPKMDISLKDTIYDQITYNTQFEFVDYPVKPDTTYVSYSGRMPQRMIYQDYSNMRNFMTSRFRFINSKQHIGGYFSFDKDLIVLNKNRPGFLEFSGVVDENVVPIYHEMGHSFHLNKGLEAYGIKTYANKMAPRAWQEFRQNINNPQMIDNWRGGGEVWSVDYMQRYYDRGYNYMNIPKEMVADTIAEYMKNPTQFNNKYPLLGKVYNKALGRSAEIIINDQPLNVNINKAIEFTHKSDLTFASRGRVTYVNQGLKYQVNHVLAKTPFATSKNTVARWLMDAFKPKTQLKPYPQQIENFQLDRNAMVGLDMQTRNTREFVQKSLELHDPYAISGDRLRLQNNLVNIQVGRSPLMNARIPSTTIYTQFARIPTSAVGPRILPIISKQPLPTIRMQPIRTPNIRELPNIINKPYIRPIAENNLENDVIGEVINETINRNITHNITQTINQNILFTQTMNFTSRQNLEARRVNEERPTLLPFEMIIPKMDNDQQGYNVFVRESVSGSRRAFLKINTKPLPRNKALSEGSYYVDNTTARSFVVKKAGKSKVFDEGFPSLEKFRGPRGQTRLPVGTYVEKGIYFNDTPGELQGLTAKALKKMRGGF